MTVTEASATELSGVDVAQLTLTSAGPITDSGDIRVTAAAVFDAGANPITFGDRPSETTNFGSLALTAGDVSVAEHSSTLLGAVSVENLHLTSAGAITDSIDTEVTGVAVLNAGTNRITLGGQAGATTNFGRIELIGGSVNVLEDSDTLLVGADVDRLRYNSAGKIVIDGKVIKARGLLTLTAVGDIEVHDLPWLGAGLSEVVAGEIVFRAGGAIDIDNGAVLESATGKVTNAPPLLRIGELDPDDTIVPGDPTQELTGTVGGIEAQGDKLEQGANFTVAVVWDDGLRSELAGVSAGDKVVWRVREDGSSNAVITPGSGTGPIVVLVVREYGVDHLTTVTQTEMRAAVEVRNDPSIRLDDGSAVDLNAAHSAVVSRLSSQEIPQKEEPPEEAPPQVVGITAALEERELVVVPPPPLLAAEISTTPLLQKTPPERLRPGQGRVAEQLRELYIVKVVKAESGEQEQDEHYPLPEDALSDLNVLLERLKQEGLPNGWYRIYLKEKGLPRRRVLEFYKWGDQIGDYPREPGRGSNPAPEAGASNRADGAFPDATAGSRGVRREVVPLATTPVLAAEPAAAVEAEVDAGSRTGPLALPPHDDGRATAETAAATAWTRSLDEAMQSADDHSFTKAARLCRRLRR